MIYEALKLLVIVFVLTDMAEFISEVIMSVERPKNKLLGVIYLGVGYVLSCSKCFGFWFSLIYTGGDLFTSASIALLINYIKMIEYKIKGKTEL